MKLRYFAILPLCFFADQTQAGTIRSAHGATAHVSDRASGAFQCLVSALDRQGYRIRFMGGWRAHGSVRGSLHPRGLALDINQLARGVTRPRMPSNEIALANRCGLVSGAQWANNDSGHFQLGGWAGRGRHYAHRHTKVRYARRLKTPTLEFVPLFHSDGQQG